MHAQRRLVVRSAWAVPLAAAAGGVLATTPVAVATPEEVTTELPGARLHGQGQLSFFGLRVYDARLWTLATFRPQDYAQHAFALELHYLRRLDGAAIAERSLVEMRRVGEVAAADAERWLAAMKRAFPDVRDGDRIVGLHRPGEGARFFFNGRLLDEVPDAAFARSFFSIWLSPRTSEPGLRAALLAGEGARR